MPPAWPKLDLPVDIGHLLISCPDRPGIIATLSRFLFERGANVLDLQQHATAQVGGTFYSRIEFQLPNLEARARELERELATTAEPFSMQWRIEYPGRAKRLAVLVSKADHALFELLWQRRAGDLKAEIAMVISNHPDLRETVEAWGTPFHHIPVTRETKSQAEDRMLELTEGKADAVVLARYMQIVTPRFIARFPNRMINIHHSFLPAFVGADPYARAFERGVKLIGATAHYVTEELDAGPIIEQDVQRVDHRHPAAELKRIGRHIERVVLARAVAWHVEDRILVHGNKTIVFT